MKASEQKSTYKSTAEDNAAESSGVTGKTRRRLDSPWKKVIELYFRDFIQFFFPQIADKIKWKRGFQFLDKEFHQAVRGAATGTRLADKLVKVWTNEGHVAWVLIHIEVQGRQQSDFAQRMYIYNYRIFDYYKKNVVSLAILADKHQSWRPDTFSSRLWGCELNFKFPVVKLKDYERQWTGLGAIRNPFAIVTMAHLLAQKTYNDSSDRFAAALAIIRHLYKQGYNRKNVVNLLTFIQWVLTLPAELEEKLYEEVKKIEENPKMEYVPSIIRFAKEEGFEEGKAQGLQEGVKISLEIKFGKKGLSLLPMVSKFKSPKDLNAFQKKLKTAQNIEELKTWCRARK